ncbi:MAG: hypothetical protein KDB07_11215 [Planctomycetes bacterium]|nr:hypothetical protein [Planctomycetota bacterium]
MKLAGVVLDQHDDYSAQVIRQALRPGEVPELWKTASLPDPTSLLDEEFALVLKEGGTVLRKYATADAVSTAISAFYFMQCGGKLPLEAQKTAALNLTRALCDYDLGVPDPLKKLAQAKMLEDNLAGLNKVANIIDVSSSSAPTSYKHQRPATEYALVKEGQAYYPIDTFEQLREATRYYSQYEDQFDLADRRQYCTKVAARARLLGEPVPQRMLRYVGIEKDAQAIEVGLYWRRKHAGAEEIYGRVLDGIASDAPYHEPEFLVGLLAEFDKAAGLTHLWDQGRGVPNPIASVYKTAMEHGGDDVIWEEGNDRLSSKQLTHFMHTPTARQHLKQMLPSDLVNGLFSDPVDVFSSLPDPHKLMIARLATDNYIGRDPTHSPA